MLAFFALISLATAVLIALLVQRNALALGLVQAPNERSSHTIPTPRGGGVGIAIAALALLPLLGADFRLGIAGLCCGLLAVLGFADDRFDLPALPRLATQFILVGAAIWTAPWTDTSPLALVALAVLLVGGVWWVNLFNFMDGIDGIAATQALLIAGIAAVLWLLQDPAATASPVFAWLVVVAAASLGFLLLNWPPARIFMGDVGSNFLALALFALALHTIASGALDWTTWVILPAAFASDATVTLLRRALKGERVMSAHRSHAYQILSRRWGGHRPVTLLYAAVTLIWCGGLAALAQFGIAPGLLLVAIAYLPLIVFCIIVGRT